MGQVFDLFGHPVPMGPGRPAHVPTDADRSKVNMLLAFGWSNERIARAVGITRPTLSKHYSAQLRFREEQRDRMTASLAMRLWGQVEAGNVAAMKEFRKVVEANDLMVYGQTQPPEKEAKLGKKEAALAAAQQPDPGTTLGELMAKRQGGALH